MIKITKEMETMAITETKKLLDDKNRTAKAIAAMLRNKIEDFHVAYLSDLQMKELNPLIRNAVYTFLTDYTGSRSDLDDPKNIQLCNHYIAIATAPFFLKYDFTDEVFDEFLDIIFEELIICLYSAADKGLQLLAHEKYFVPDYWEDCVYLEGLQGE